MDSALKGSFRQFLTIFAQMFEYVIYVIPAALQNGTAAVDAISDSLDLSKQQEEEEDRKLSQRVAADWEKRKWLIPRLKVNSQLTFDPLGL